MRSLSILLALCLPLAASRAQESAPGFVPETSGIDASHLAGRWINQFLFSLDGATPQTFWQIVEFGADGATTHDYFSADPRLHTAPPYTRIASTWSVGTFVDPQPAKGKIAVIRIQPNRQTNYDAMRERFVHIRGNFAPQFRRFSFSADFARLTLSELVVLEVPGNLLLSFPADVRDMVFKRMPDPASPVRATTWGQIKKRRSD